ncbi:hypothetical protein [Clostridium beijerinckii]|uniref:Uncharacterized protein n=1 Tax=Clostridium beijerinckii TaxID=1520 RepID=A0AAX0B3W1_CLOBE|nr:hypothetical protein [Clostridium beijerinckii]NRT90080.1 hypothetical protein [Clostridium beijerinckii]NYC69610.1 hypothetical protein [Clostridium beijerinckii]
MKWIIENADWIFSGIGVTIILIIGGLFFKKKLDSKNVQTINSGNNSTNIQGGKNVNVNIGGKDGV